MATTSALVPLVLSFLVALVVSLLASPGRTSERLRAEPRAPVRVGGATADRGWLRRLRLPLSALALLGGWAVIGGLPGAVAGAVAAVTSWRVLGGTEGPAQRRRREQLGRDLPVAVQLLAGCLVAGNAVEPALRVVAAALPGPLAEEFGHLHHRLALGVDPALLWSELSRHEQLGPMGRCLGRAHDSGASVADAVSALAEDLAARDLAQVEQRARTVDVRASAPLGVCLLPAFLLLGVVPMVAGVFTGIDVFG